MMKSPILVGMFFILTSYAMASVYISSINFDAPGNDHQNLNGEWVKITNNGAKPVSMTSWTLSDEGNKHIYRFPMFSLGPGSTATVYTGSGRDTATELYWGQSQAVWNNDGDTAALTDSKGSRIDQKSNR